MTGGNSGGSSFGTSGGTGLVGAGSNDGLTKTITTKITRFNTRGSVGDDCSFLFLFLTTVRVDYLVESTFAHHQQNLWY
jgi:hypothetical protein